MCKHVDEYDDNDDGHIAPFIIISVQENQKKKKFCCVLMCVTEFNAIECLKLTKPQFSSMTVN